jgi:hypothetical protein
MKIVLGVVLAVLLLVAVFIGVSAFLALGEFDRHEP